MNNRKRLFLPTSQRQSSLRNPCWWVRSVDTKQGRSIPRPYLHQVIFKDRKDVIKPNHYNKEWNCQPMHLECNTKRGGQMYGFPLFTCSCHWLQIDRTSKGYVLTLHYRKSSGKLEFTVTTEENSFVFRNLSTGEYAAQFGGSSEVEISAMWTMGQVKPGKKGMTGPGQLGHAFPRLDPEEVHLFNRLEIERFEGSSSETIDIFNRRILPLWVRYEVI